MTLLSRIRTLPPLRTLRRAAVPLRAGVLAGGRARKGAVHDWGDREVGVHLTITNEHEAARLLKEETWNAIISIGGSQWPPVGFRLVKHRLRLVFDDITCESMASIMAGYVPPTEADVRQLADFARQIKDGDRVLIHCAAGISRSTAAAMIVLMERGATEDEALAEVRRIRPCARPNALMLAIYGEMR